MQVIVIGCGKVGSKLGAVLAGEGHDVVIVDNDRNSFKALAEDFNGITIAGVPIDQDVLKQAGIETADALAAVTPDDNVNIMACQVAKEIFKVPRVIARIYNPEREHVFHQFGLETICPTNITVGVIHSMMMGKKGMSACTVADTAVLFRYEEVPEENLGKFLKDYEVDDNAMIFGVVKNGTLLLAKPDIMPEKGDMLVIAEKQELQEV